MYWDCVSGANNSDIDQLGYSPQFGLDQISNALLGLSPATLTVRRNAPPPIAGGEIQSNAACYDHISRRSDCGAKPGASPAWLGWSIHEARACPVAWP